MEIIRRVQRGNVSKSCEQVRKSTKEIIQETFLNSGMSEAKRPAFVFDLGAGAKVEDKKIGSSGVRSLLLNQKKSCSQLYFLRKHVGIEQHSRP